MPMSRLVSKSLETARMPMPILVLLMSSTRATTSTITRTGVITVTIFVFAGPMTTVSEIKGMVGYCLLRPPVIYSTRFCKV